MKSLEPASSKGNPFEINEIWHRFLKDFERIFEGNPLLFKRVYMDFKKKSIDSGRKLNTLGKEIHWFEKKSIGLTEDPLILKDFET